MKRLLDALERRDHPRLRRQLPCKLLVRGRNREAVLRDVSATGVYVQTHAPVSEGDELVLSFQAPEGWRFVLEARRPRPRFVPQSLSQLTTPGFGLRLEDPPPAFLRWVESGQR